MLGKGYNKLEAQGENQCVNKVLVCGMINVYTEACAKCSSRGKITDYIITNSAPGKQRKGWGIFDQGLEG